MVGELSSQPYEHNDLVQPSKGWASPSSVQEPSPRTARPAAVTSVPGPLSGVSTDCPCPCALPYPSEIEICNDRVGCGSTGEVTAVSFAFVCRR